MHGFVRQQRRLLSAAVAAVILTTAGSAARAAIVTRNVDLTLSAADVASYDLDVDLNGTADFTFTAAYVPDPDLSVGFDTIDFPFGGNNGVVIDGTTGNGFPTVSRLATGTLVSASNTYSLASFDQGNLYFFTTFDAPSGNFNGVTGLVGLRFDAADGIHYGFATVSVKDVNAATGALDLTLGTVGYNTVAGQPITVPEPALATLGVGAFGLLALRRRRLA